MTNTGIIVDPLLVGIFHVAFFVFLAYFFILLFYYFLLAVLGFIEEKKRALESEAEIYPMLLDSTFTLPVSVIIPAFNEEEWIRDAVGAVLKLQYPELEVIVVNDGSTDRTLEILTEMLELKSYDKTYVKEYADGKVREIYKSSLYPNVTVISKKSGYKKAGALNAGLNIAKYKYICVIDADTVLEPDALMRVMAHVQRDPDRIIGIGSYFGLSNGFTVKDGTIVERKFSYKPIIAYQNLEYIRAFIGNRIGWSRFNAMPIVSGGFGLWRRDVVHDLGGFDRQYSSEDLEFTFRAHDYIVQHKEKDYRIVMLPYLIGWTEGPNNIKSLALQRNRWQRVIDEAVWKYKYMLFNPKYGSFAFITLPYYVLYEVFGSFFEVISMFMVILGWAMGFLNVELFFAMVILMALTQGAVSMLCMFAFLRNKGWIPLKYAVYLTVLGFLEFFWYRWILSWAKIAGTYGYSHNVRDFTKYDRKKDR